MCECSRIKRSNEFAVKWRARVFGPLINRWCRELCSRSLTAPTFVGRRCSGTRRSSPCTCVVVVSNCPAGTRGHCIHVSYYYEPIPKCRASTAHRTRRRSFISYPSRSPAQSITQVSVSAPRVSSLWSLRGRVASTHAHISSGDGQSSAAAAMRGPPRC